MCNEMCKNKEQHESTLNILLYRIDKIEEERRRENKDIMNLLQSIQEGQTQINKELAVHETKIQAIEHEIEAIEDNKVELTQFDAECNNMNKRLDVYKQIMIAVAGGVGVSLLVELIKFI